MDPLTGIVLILVLVIGAGGGIGIGMAVKGDNAAKAIEAQTEAIKAQGDAIAKVSEQASKPIVIDAELRSELAEVPVQCRRDAGGDPLSVHCQWATCLQFGQSSAQRPECRAVETLMVDSLKAASPKVE